MKQIELKRFSRFYVNSRHLEVDNLLRRILDLPADFVLPVYQPHGVDFGFSRAGFDLYKQEPIFWATNPRQAALVRPHKPVFTAPHPFLMAAYGKIVPRGKGSLVIGPPPGVENDCNMHKMLAAGHDPAVTTILIKPHAQAVQSERYWRGLGYSTMAFTDAGTGYEAMVKTLGQFREVIGGTVSSALFFAAALGKPVRLLRGYRFRAYEGLHIANIVDYAAPEAQQAVRRLNSADPAEATASAREILGEEYSAPPEVIREQLICLIDELRLPLFVRHKIPHFAKKLAISCAVRANRPSLLLTSLGEFVRGRLTSDVLILETDEAALWLDGPTGENLKFGRTRYIRHHREPGMAVDPY